MNFDLSNAGTQSAQGRTINPNWNEGLSILEVTENNFILSNQLSINLGIEDNAICTLFFNEAGVFLGNVTNVEGVANMADKDLLKISQVKITKELKNARTARRKELLNLWTKNGNELGNFTIDQEFVKSDDVLFPLVKLTPYIVAELEEVVEEEITYENHVSASEPTTNEVNDDLPFEVDENEGEVIYNSNGTL